MKVASPKVFRGWNAYKNKGLIPAGCVEALPRSGYTEQPRVLTLGQVVVKCALKVAPDVWCGGE